MARSQSIGKKFNTVAGLMLFAGAVIGVIWLARLSRAHKGEQLIGAIGRKIGVGGAGSAIPVGGGQFGPTSSAVASAPAVAAAGPASGGINVLQPAVDLWKRQVVGAGWNPILTPEIARTLPSADPVGGAAVFSPGAGGSVNVTAPGRAGGSVSASNVFLGYVPGTNIPLFA